MFSRSVGDLAGGGFSVGGLAEGGVEAEAESDVPGACAFDGTLRVCDFSGWLTISSYHKDNESFSWEQLEAPDVPSLLAAYISRTVFWLHRFLREETQKYRGDNSSPYRTFWTPSQ